MLGRMHDQPRLAGAVRNRARLGAHYLKLAFTGFRSFPTLLQYFKFTETYRRLRRDAAVPLTDELTLFAVDASTRGTGKGSELYRAYLAHLRALGRDEYRFYENRGMVRAACQDLQLRFDGAGETLGVYLYSGSAQG